jgi:hypothetical protein
MWSELTRVRVEEHVEAPLVILPHTGVLRTHAAGDWNGRPV